MTEMKKNPTVEVKSLLTHNHPDQDAILGIHLLRKHGGADYPGAADAPVTFTSANALPGGKSAEELEKDGIIAIDTGGGRFDNHPVEGNQNKSKWDSCASSIVAEALGVTEKKEYKFLLEYTRNHDTLGQSLKSKDAVHHLTAPHGLIDGLHRIYSEEEVVEIISTLCEGITSACTEKERSREEIGKVFDEALAKFILEEDFEESVHFRKSEAEWPAMGESHNAAISKDLNFRRDLEKLLKFSARMISGDELALPESELERRVLLPSALIGFKILFKDDEEKFQSAVRPLFRAAVKREADWFHAIDEVERSAKTLRGRGISLVSIASKNGLVIKAARYKRGGNAILYMNPANGNITLQSGQRKDGRPLLNLERIASRIRTAEMIRTKGQGKRPPSNIGAVGLVEGWFLHQSLKLLNRGSPKAPDMAPSELSWKEIIEIVGTDFRPDDKMPDWTCPPDHCSENDCSYFQIKLPNCYVHRERTKNVPKSGTLGDLFSQELNKVKKNK